MSEISVSDKSDFLQRRAETSRRQTLAADPAHSIWVSANAGTGKTKVLTDRVIRLLLRGVEPEKILCLTFTKTAAAEMSNRLFAKLGPWTALEDLLLLKEVQDLDPDFDVGRLNSARRLFAKALETPGGLKIQTIHAFCQSVLERFPLEAGVAPGLSVLDDASSRTMLREAEVQLYTKTSGAVVKALARTAVRYDGVGLSELLRQVLFKRAEVWETLKACGGIEGLEAGLLDFMDLPKGASLSGERDRAVQELRRLEPEIREAAACLSEGIKTDQKKATLLLEFLGALDWSADLESYSRVYLKADGLPFVKMMTKALGNENPDALEFLEREQDRVETQEHLFRKLRAIEMTVDLLRLGYEFVNNYDQLKSRRGVLDYDDLIEKTAQLLGDDNAISWVHYKLDGGLHHILVDEAQDTSPKQWAVISALAEEFFSDVSGQRDNLKNPRTLFAVGDEKQSIYSFQGADPRKFDEMRAFFEGRVTGAGRSFSGLELILSFRSTTEILQAVDTVFEDEGNARGLTSNGDRISHEADRLADAGLVELWPTVAPEPEDDINPWDAPLDRVAPSAPRALVAEQIANQIEHWIKTREPIIAGDRPIEPGDILILVQRRNSFVDEMIRALKKRSIPVAGRDRMILAEQIAVMDLMALADFALLPEDDLTLATVLKSPFIGLCEEDLFELAHGRSGTLWSALRKRSREEKFAAAFAELSRVLARVDVLRPFEFFVEALGPGVHFETTGRERLLGRLGPEAGDPIDEFLSHGLAFEQLEPPSLQGFLAYVHGDQAEIKRDFDHEPREVRIMTVHGAKGLEGRIVFLPDTCTLASGRNASPLITIEKEGQELLVFGLPAAEAHGDMNEVREGLKERRLEEQRRLLYVAMTRARDRLYITGFETKKKNPKGCWYDLVERSLSPIMKNVRRFDGQSVLRLRLEHEDAVADGSKKTEQKGVIAQFVRPPPWVRDHVLPEPPPRRFAPSGLGMVFEEDGAAQSFTPASVSPFLQDGPDRFRRGLAVHRLLELLPNVDPEMQRPAAEAFLQEPARGFGPDDAAQIASEVMAVLEHPEFSEIFGSKSLAEVPVAGRLPGTDIALNGSVDRLVFGADHVLIVDYKTNRPPPVDVKDLAPAYIMQMAAYRALLTRIAGKREVRALLLWTDQARIMEVPPEMMDAQIRRLQVQV
jgi:ATP-dependent helicase/nuclease subunit A